MDIGHGELADLKFGHYKMAQEQGQEWPAT